MEFFRVEGFEPPMTESKSVVFTAWLYPNIDPDYTTWTCGLHIPNVAIYQTDLSPDILDWWCSFARHFCLYMSNIDIPRRMYSYLNYLAVSIFGRVTQTIWSHLHQSHILIQWGGNYFTQSLMIATTLYPHPADDESTFFGDTTLLWGCFL